jgi:DNA repair protein RadC
MGHDTDDEQLDVIFRCEAGHDLATSEFCGSKFNAKVPLRDIARTALTLDARSVVIRHNHPSGDVRPSRADLLATRQIVAALNLIGVSVHDHHIVAGEQCFSFREAGLI